MDPFPPTCDPAAYVARAATEEVLAGLVRELGEDTGTLVLSGPSGLGKTMVLRVLARRVEAWATCVHLSYSAFTPEDLALFALGLVGEPLAGRDPWDALQALGREGHPLVLALDDATALPVETARELARRVAGSGGRLRLVLNMVDDRKAGQVLAALGDRTRSVRLSDPMEESETRLYVAARLEMAATPATVVERFSEDVVTRLHRESFGNPRTLGHLASRIVLQEPPENGPRTPDRVWEETARAFSIAPGPDAFIGGEADLEEPVLEEPRLLLID